jgi:3-hydroxyacyl-CoA dehydrogenase
MSTTDAAGPVTTRRAGGVAVVTIDNPPVNAASQAVRAGLVAAVEAAEADHEVAAIVIAAAGRTFVAGADIREFGKPPQPPILAAVANRIEACTKPVVAALHGTALGGGLEIALAAHARIAAPDARFGLPEVKLGIIPGAGGTQRLPRLVGVPAAIDMVTTGRQVGTAEALALGLIDRISEGDLLEAAIDMAGGIEAPRRTGERRVPAFDRAAAEAAVARAEAKARGQRSPG